MAGAVGTEGRLRLDWDDTEHPVEGDLLRSVPGGSCYRILSLREGARTPAGWKRLNLTVLRLGRDAVAQGDDGVFLFRWHRR